MNLPTPWDFNGPMTVKLQAWLDASADGHGYLPAYRPGYEYEHSLAIHSDTRLSGAGRSTARLRNVNPEAGIGNARMRWHPMVDPDNGGPPFDHDISIDNIGFEGDADAEVPGYASFLAFVGVEGLLLRDVGARNWRSDLIVLHNTIDVTIDHCKLSEWGKRTHPTPGDGQYVGGCAIFAWVYNERLRITNCDVHDGAGGLWLQDCPETILTGARVWNTCEFDVVGVGLRSVYTSNIIGKTTRLDVSGHNAELHGEEFVYANNVHSGADGSNVYASNLRNVLLCDNLYLRPGEGSACVTLASHGLWAGVGDHPPECVLIDGGLYCDQNKRASHAVLVVDSGGGLSSHVKVSNSNTGDSKQWRGAAVQVERKVEKIHN